MKQNNIKLNESQLEEIVAESVKRILKETEFDVIEPIPSFDVIDSIPSDEFSDFGKFYPGFKDSDEDFQKCYEDLDLHVENMTKEYNTETIISVLEKLLDFYKNV